MRTLKATCPYCGYVVDGTIGGEEDSLELIRRGAEHMATHTKQSADELFDRAVLAGMSSSVMGQA